MDYLSQAQDILNRGRQAASSASSSSTASTASTASTWGSTAQQPKQDWTLRGLYGEAYRAMGWNQQMGMQLFSLIDQEKQDPNSKFYSRYSQPTNQAVRNLQSYGFDTSVLNDDWFSENMGWIQNNLEYRSGTGNSPSAPTKKSTMNNRIAYELYQYSIAEDRTKKAEQEVGSALADAMYWAQRSDLNLSDDDIVDRVKQNIEKNYSTLSSMKNDDLSPLELNRAVEFSDDMLYGAVWAARNPSFQGNIEQAMAASYLGMGQTWHVNEEIEQKRNQNNPDTYAPYSIGMTMDDAGRFFGVSRFDDNTIKEIRASLDFNDPKAVKHYEDVVKAEDTTKKAEEQKSTIDGLVSKWLGKDYSEEKILNLLDKELAKSDYSVLNQMDLTITNGLDPIGLTRAVDYSKRDLVNYIKDEIARRGDKLSVTEVANGTQSVNPIPEKVKTVDEINREAEALARTAHINKPANENQQIGATDQVDAAKMLSVGKEPEKPTYVQTPEQQAKAAYDARYGAGAYERDIQAAEQAKTVSYGAQAQKDSDAMVRDTVADIDDELTPAESNRLGNYSGASDAAQAQLKGIKTNAGNNPESLESIVQKSTAGVTKDYIEGSIGIYGRANQYEYTQYNLTQLQTTEEELLAMLGDKIYAGKQADTFFTTEVNGNRYRVQMSGDLTEIEGIDNINNPDVPTPVYASYGLYDSPDEYDDDTKVWQAIENSGEVDAFRAKYAEEAAKINAANQLEITDEDQQALKALRETQIGIEDAQAYIAENKDQYDQDLAEFNRQAERRAVHIQNLQAMGIDTTEIETADTVLNYLTNFTSYEATRWETYNPSYKYAVMIEDGEDRNAVLATAKDEHNEILEQIKDVEWLQGYLTDHNIQIPDDVQNNIDRRLAKLQRDAKDYDFFAKQWEGDFEEYAAKGEAQEQEEYLRYNATHRTNNPDEVPGSLYNLVGAYNTYMSDDEKKTFYYLKAKDAENNTNEAEEYARFLADETYGVLQVRGREGMEKSAEEIVNSGWLGAVTANVGAVLLSPYTAISGLAYDAYVWASGNEFNPNSSFLNAMHFRSKTREATAKEILEGLGTKKIDEKTGEITYEENAATKIAQGGYEMLTNRADSMVNAAFFGWMFGGVGNSVLQEFMSAAPMGLSAAYEAVARAKERGASDAQAYGVAAVTFFAETATEAISLENMGEAFGLGKEVGAGTYKEFLKNWLTKSGISEAFGESVNDIVENFADEKIMGVMSDHANLVYEYRMKGYSKEEAELMAREDEVKGVLRTALISYLSPGLDVIQTVRGRYHYYGDVTRELQQNGYNDATIRSVRKGIRAEERAQIRQERQNAERPMGPINYDLLEERYGVKAPAADNTVRAETAQTTAETEQAQAEQAKRESEQFIVEFEILETAKTYDQAGQQAAISSVLDENAGEAETDMANAASVNLGPVLGADVNAVDEIQTLMTGSRVESVSIGMVKQGLQYAALGGESSASRQAVQSQEYKNATPDVKARMLAEAAQADMQNETVQQNVQKAVFEDRVAKAEGVLLAQGAGKLIAQAEQKVQAAAENTKKATDMLNTQQDVLQAAREAMTAAAVQVENDPASNDNVQMLNHAITELENQGKVAQEYEQSLANAQQKEQETRDQTANVKKEEMLKIRQNAERMVREQDQQRAEAQALEAERQRQFAADQAEAERQQKIADQQSGKLEEDSTRARLERLAAERGYTGADAEKFVNDVYEFWNSGRFKTMDKTRQLSGAESALVMGALSRRFGVNVVIENMEGQDHGKYDADTDTITLDGRMPLGQVMVEFGLHELTHSLEKTGAYQKYADFVLADRYKSDAELNEAVAKMMADREAAGHPVSETQAKRELVAEFTRLWLNDKDTIYRMVDAGLGGRIRNALHNINQFIRNNLGLKGQQSSDPNAVTPEQLRRAERMFQKAIQERARMQQKAETAKTNNNVAMNPNGPVRLTDWSAMQEIDVAGVEFTDDDTLYITADGERIPRDHFEGGSNGDGGQRNAEFGDWVTDEAEKRYQPVSKPFVRASENVSGETKFIKMPDGSVKHFNKTSNDIARDINKTYKTNISNANISSSIQNARNLFIHGDIEGSVNAVQELAGEIEKAIGLSRNSLQPSALAQALNNYFGNRIIPISESDSNALVSVYGSVAKANRVLADAGVKARLRLDKNNNKTGLRLDDVFRGNDHVTAEGKGFDISQALGGTDTAKWEDILYELGHQREVYINQLRDEYTNGGTISEDDLRSEIHGMIWNQVVDYSDVAVDENNKVQVQRNDESINAEAETDWGADENDFPFSAGVVDLTDAQKAQMLREAGVDYESAVERGDMEAAQEDVDFAAEQAGYNELMYHGTTGDFNVFDMDKSKYGAAGYGFYFGNENVAKRYEDKALGGHLMKAFVKTDNLVSQDDTENKRITPDMVRNLLNRLDVPIERYEGLMGNIENSISKNTDYDIIRDLEFLFNATTNLSAKETMDAMREELHVDGIRNNYEVVLWDNTLIKSADPVTYDDNGNVIPLNERFSDSPDIRYSVGGERTEADMNQALIDAGIITQEDIDAYQNMTSRPLEGKSRKWSQEEGPAQRQFGGENGMLQSSDEIAQAAKDYALRYNAYFPDTNADQIERAINWIKKNGSQKEEDGSIRQTTDGYYESIQKVTGKSFDYRSADGQARMVATMAMAVAKNDVASQVALADAFNRQGTDLGRALQSRKLFKMMTPGGRIASIQKMMQDQQDELNAKGLNVELKFSDWIYQAAAVAESEADFRKVQQAAAAELGQQVPASWRDKLRGWRMLSMLGNPRTHIRNVLGNALFVPVVGLKNKMGALMELGTEKGNRTKTLSLTLDKDIKAFAKQDALTMKDTLTGEAKFNESTMVQREQKAFNGLLQSLMDFNSDLLEREDWTFLKGHYTRALGGWMQANGYTVEQVQNDAALLEQGRAYAVQEAQKATYRDFNQLAATLNKVSQDGGVAGFLVDATLPFKKTPANILRRGIEYSPVGIMRSLTTDLAHLKQWNDYENGKLSVMPDKAISPTQFIDRLCSGLSGTMVMAVGALLASSGIVSCGLDDDEDKFEKAKGNQKYAFKFSIAGHDFTYTMDWAAPMSMPFFVGAAIQQQFAKEGEFDMQELVNAFGNITEPVFNLSMLDGVNTLFKTSQYDDTNNLTQIGAKIGSNYVTSYVPSLLGAIARIVDDKQRKAYVESGKGTGVLGSFRYAREQVENKIPVLSQTNIPVRDIWGEEKTSSLAERILENLVSPGYHEDYREDPIINEMARLYDVTQDAGMIPKEDPDRTITYKKQRYVLKAEEWDQYKANRNQTAHRCLTELIGTDDYKDADDTTRAQMIKDVWSYADQVGRAAVIPGYELEDMGANPVQKIAGSSKVTSYKTDMMKALDEEDYDGYDAMVERLHQEGVEDSEIKTKISGKYRDMYKDAYRKGDLKKMAEIEDLLDNTGYEFDIGAWEKQVDEKYGVPENEDTTGRYGRGNIDLNNRKVVNNNDGSISTEQSFSFYDEDTGKEVLIPTVINGKIVSEDEAIEHYYQTGEYLGMFDTPEEADKYAEQLHNRQDWYYNR